MFEVFRFANTGDFVTLSLAWWVPLAVAIYFSLVFPLVVVKSTHTDIYKKALDKILQLKKE